jgi:hypothetical protein
MFIYHSFRRLPSRRIVIWLLASLLATSYSPQRQPPVQSKKNPSVRIEREYDKTEYHLRIDSLRTAFGFSKTFPPAFELAALLALSHYPELRNERIHFQMVKRAFPLIASRPDPWNLFRRKSEWVYNIYISEEAPPKIIPDLLKNFSFNAQVGILGHELSHTLFYLDKSADDMITIGINYFLFDHYKGHFEQDTDRGAIAHGLGWQVFEYAVRYRQNQRLSRHEIAGIDRYYLNPASVRDYMRATGLYSSRQTIQ